MENLSKVRAQKYYSSGVHSGKFHQFSVWMRERFTDTKPVSTEAASKDDC